MFTIAVAPHLWTAVLATVIVGLTSGPLAIITTALGQRFTDDRFRGHGLGGRLVQESLDQARARHLAVLPYCPFVNSWITAHREYADLLPAGRREQFGL